eukprot:366322-Amphidinium_carterae.1
MVSPQYGAWFDRSSGLCLVMRILLNTMSHLVTLVGQGYGVHAVMHFTGQRSAAAISDYMSYAPRALEQKDRIR